MFEREEQNLSSYKKVLVTGGSGFLGRRLKQSQPDWLFISSADCDLTNQLKTRNLFIDLKPDAVIHLAARVGGIKDNVKNQAEYFYQNVMINTLVLEEAYKAGVPRLLACLSTCAFPDELTVYPFSEEELFSGPPAITNFSYGMSKRLLHVGCLAYRDQHGLNYSTFCPSNIYGPGDNFGDESSHFVAAMVHKLASSVNGKTIKFWGTGHPLRQQLYVDDLCELIPILLAQHNSSVPILVAPNENLSINNMIKTLLKQTKKDIKIEFNGMMDGQFRKDGSNKKLMNLIGNYDFTSFEVGIKKTYDWYLKNK
jgi:GDP-L-fucose synthase